MRISLSEFSAAAKAAGADIVGVAPIERCAEIAPEHHPASIFPETKSVVLLGRRVTRGSLRGIEEGTNFANYACYGASWLENRFLCLTTFRVSEFLENNGWEAVPLQNLPPETPPMGVRVRKESPAPNVMLDFDDLAVRAGAGEIGYCGVFITPQFGPRQRFQAVLTDAEIEPSPLPDHRVCRHDTGCAGFCPLGAISEGTARKICGKEMPVGNVNYAICASCKNGVMPNPNHPSGKPDRIGAACVRGCVAALEEEEAIGNRFALKFRVREPWVVRTETDLFKP